jgi:O-antigen ligase
MERENSVGDAAHSVQQRAAFAYVSWHMMQDHPLWGVGFGRFYDQKMPYLQDRRQSFELESIRDLHHHNTFLSFATETGLMGIAGFLAILASWTAYSWRLSFDNVRPAMARDWGRLAVAVVLAYLPSAAFHDVTLLPQMQWLLYFVAGGAMSLAVVSQPVTEVDALLTEPTSKWLAGATLQ